MRPLDYELFTEPSNSIHKDTEKLLIEALGYIDIDTDSVFNADVVHKLHIVEQDGVRTFLYEDTPLLRVGKPELKYDEGKLSFVMHYAMLVTD